MFSEETKYDAWWLGVFGDRDPETVVSDFELTDGGRHGLAEWVHTSAYEAERVGRVVGDDSADVAHAARAIEELAAAIDRALVVEEEE